MKPMRLLSMVAVVALLGACGQMAIEPTLFVTVSPKTLSGAQVATVKVSATDSKNLPGTGTVRVTSTAGSLIDGADVTLENGEGSVTFTCDVSVDTNCKGSVKINVTWNAAIGSTSLNVTTLAVDAGSDAGSTGMDGGSMTSDGGITISLVSDRVKVIAGVGDSVRFTATVTSGTMPIANQEVRFSATAGLLADAAGGVGMTTITVISDATGHANAFLSIGASNATSATVTASTADVSTFLMVAVVTVTSINAPTVECPQTPMNCTLMGLQSSGFNETAVFKFKVVDNVGNGVPNVTVSFTLVGAPSGTMVGASADSDARGIAQVSVRAGTTIGSFSLRATALGFSVDSPTIGVRGAKPANKGFTLSCDQVNIAAYTNPNPPRDIRVNCVVTLQDRYANPVGTGTQVSFKTEAGSLPNNVVTTAYTPGSNTTEGKGGFVFQTLGQWPAVDVTPFPAAPAQYPYARNAEPSTMDGLLERNPRDGLVTFIAFLQGEEWFSDDNSNGIRDGTESFIDQGEPFVDANDNNVWDPGETLVDTPGADGGVNGVWDGPNGRWDSNAQIWTEFRILYTDYLDPNLSLITRGPSRTGASSYGTVPTNSSVPVLLFATDRNLNRPEPGTNLAARLTPSMRGSVMLASSTLADGYAFGYERTRIDAADGGICASSTPICTWTTIFGSWSEGALPGKVTLVGATPPSMTANQLLSIDSTTRSITTTVTATGTFE